LIFAPGALISRSKSSFSDWIDLMTESDGRKKDEALSQDNIRDNAPISPKPYVMPDDPEPEDAAAVQTRELTEAKDRLLRTLAEMENLRRRTTREVSDARAYGISGFARDVLDIADNLQRALDAVPAETRANADPGLAALIEGVELTEKSLHKALEKNGVKKFDPAGQKFDPNLHQAMYEVPDQSVPSGTVAHVVQAGYMIADRILRPALVGVAKGGAKPAAASSDSANN
jgi:molecular chaperone GrpE